jgi:hypothetical protein
MPSDPRLLRRRGKLISLIRWHGPDDPRVVALRREVAADAICRYIREVLGEVQLTAEQRARVVAALASPPSRPAA